MVVCFAALSNRNLFTGASRGFMRCAIRASAVLIDNYYAFRLHTAPSFTFGILQDGDTMCLWIEVIAALLLSL
jgi:hypothetical protein